MKKFISAIILAGAVGSLPVWAQEKKEAPTKEGMPMKKDMPMKGEGMQSMDRSKMKEMHGKMMEMKKSMGGMMKGQG